MNITGRSYTIKGFPFRPCITDGTWFVSGWNVCEKATGKCTTFIFGCNGIEVTLHEQESQRKINDLAQDKITEYTSFSFPEKSCLWFEFDGQRFRFCKEKPKWVNYDCGVAED